MYYRYFGLQEEPFSIAVNPKYLFMSARHRDALAHLLYGVGSGGGFILLTGEVGTGKTTINRCLMQQLPADTDVAVILNPALNAEELLASVCDELGIGYEPGATTLKDLTDRLQSFLLENHAKGRNTVLLIDEAQHLQFEVLEQIRLLTNLETNTRKLLQIILVGQPELAAMLAKPELRQLSQRVTARYNLQALNLEETDAYIRHRLQVAGLPANQELFPRAVVRRIYRYTGGIPRLVNVLCDRTLLGTYGQNKPRVDQQMLKQAAAEVLGEAGAGQTSKPRGWLLAAVLGVAVLGLVLWSRNSLLPSSSGSQPAPVATVTISPALAGEVPRAAAPMPWLRNRETAIQTLAVYLGVPAGASDTCSAALESGWRCETLRAESWDELLEVDRPAMLSLLTPQRFASHAVLVGVSGENAVIIGDQSRQTVALAELGPLWRGEFLILWQPPALYSTPFGLGDRGPLVTWLAQEFAQLDGQTQALATDVFNANLEQRVRLFQRQHGLLDDGVVGLKTLLKFNLARGVDVPLQGSGSALASGGKP